MIVNNNSDDSNSFDFKKTFTDVIREGKGLSSHQLDLIFSLFEKMYSPAKRFYADVKFISRFTLVVLLAFVAFVIYNRTDIATLKEKSTEKNLTNVITEIVINQLKKNNEIKQVIEGEVKNQSKKREEDLANLIVTEVSKQIDKRVFGLNEQLLYPFSYRGRVDLISEVLDYQPLSSGMIYDPDDNVCTLNISYNWKMSEKELRSYKEKFVEISTYKKIGNNNYVLYRKLFALVGGFYKNTDHPKRIANVSRALAQILFEKGDLSCEFAEVNLKPIVKKKSR